MKWSTTASFALAAGGVLALVALVTHERSQSAAEFLQSVERRYAKGDLGLDQLLRELALAQAQAEHEGQRELATRVQLRRGRVLLDLGSFGSARTELAAVAAEGGARADLELLRIELERRAGDPAAGLELARAWLEQHPDDARALELSGQLLRMQSDALRDEALRACEKQLIIADAGRAGNCVRELAARPASDLRRVALARDLRSIHGPRLESSAERVLVLCDRAAAQAAAAREAFGRSLEHGFDAGTLAQLGEMLEQAGLGEQALDLLTAASKRPALLENERATTFLLHALVQRGRWRYATLVASAWLEKHPGSPEFLLDACQACYQSLGDPGADPVRLYNWGMALSLMRTKEMGVVPYFYVGEAFFHLQTREMIEQAHVYLSLFALVECPEPVPGARVLAFRHLAECFRTLGMGAEEREAIESALALDPRASGETWLRLAEIQLAAAHGGFRSAEQSWARGMALLPGREVELLPRWLEIGALELRGMGLDPRSIVQDLQDGRSVPPSSAAAPFELYTLVRAHIEAGKLYEAQLQLQELERAVPDFVPAIDLRIELARARDRTKELVVAFLARLELTGYDDHMRELRRALPEGALSPADLRRVVRADPHVAGHLALARTFAARGEPSTALRFLLEIPPDQLGRPEQVFLAQLELQSGAAGGAFERLSAFGDELGRTPEALETWVDAGLRAGRADGLREQLPQRILALELERGRFLALADRLLASGEAALAQAALERLDQAGKPFRSGDVLWRLSACALARGEPGIIGRTLECAAAFDTRGEVELLALLALPAKTDSDRLQGAVQAVRKAGWNSSALAQAALALLAEEPEALRSALALARRQDARDPLPALLDQAQGTLAQDSPDGAFIAAAGRRGLAKLVLALERPALGAYASISLDALGASAGSRWPAWFRARLHRNAGERESEERVLRALLAQDPRFAAAWERLLELRSHASDEGAGELELRLARDEALGDSAGSPAERDWDRSRKFEREGDFEHAFAAARRAGAAAPESGPIQRHLGRLALSMERLPEALAAYRAALPLLPATSGARSTGEFLELLDRARVSVPQLLDAEAERAELESLAERLPNDPRVLLAQAQNDLETIAIDPAFGAERASQRLEHFRELHAGRSFEELAAGSTEGWTRFLLELDPARARAFLEAELDRDPGNLQAWTLLPRCSAAAGRAQEALDEVSFVEQLAPGAGSLAEYLRLRARGDWTPEGIALVAEQLQRLDPALASSPAERAIELRAYLALGPSGVSKAVEIGTLLPPADFAAEPPARRAEIFWMQAIALLARDEAQDRGQARERSALLGTLLGADPARQPLLAALRGLAQPASAGP